ncbi:matrixin family metalloprotease [Patescibacteria group bacterium]|nr:matrixin family metalloprotease [Patescibacteria group bacterium]MBU2633164.1 matrixin family metalloprotease [Patescibacteria group bacterium]
MKKYIILGLFVAMLMVSVGVVLAAKPDTAPRGLTKVTMPSHAVEVAPGVFSLGTAMNNGKVVEGYAFVHYKKGYQRPEGKGGKAPKGDSQCYGFLSKGAKWKTVEPYIVDPTNTRGLDGTFIKDNMMSNIAKWESASGKNILGDEVAGIVDGADTVSPDNKNEVYFADIDSQGAIGVTIIWGIFGGPPQGRELVEWDMIFDDVDFDWSMVGEAGKMDFENIATHELGHSVGMGDLYTDECSEQTMYGYADYGETKKGTLEAGDITGIQELYK